MSKTAIVFTCAHADPRSDNTRANLLGHLIYDVRPDYVVDLGDTADIQSLSSHDTRNPQALVHANYEKDIDSYTDFQERVRHKIKKNKVKRPAYFGHEGNHEHRIRRALSNDPRLSGSRYGVSFDHLEVGRWYDEYHPYHNSAPAISNYDGVSYAHFIGAGNSGREMAGLHHAYSLVQKRHCSTTVGHSHKRSMFFKDDAYPNASIGLVAGCFKGREEEWAGQANAEWWKGVVIKRNIEDGYYDPEFVSLKRLEAEYGD